MTRPLPSTVAHLDALVATGGEGHLVISTPMPERVTPARPAPPWASWTFATTDVDAAAAASAALDAQGRNVYVRTNLLAAPLPASPEGWSWKRGTADQTGSVVALAVDLDIAGPGHRNGKGEHPLPTTTAEVMAIIAALPAPSMLINTEGGFHAWWLLEHPETDCPVELLEGWADRIVGAGAAAGFHVDRPDPARVLRVCGTHRRKPGVPVNLVTLEDVAGWPAEGLALRPWCPGGRYNARDLIDALPAPMPPTALRPPPTPHRVHLPREVGPADAVSRLTWAQILQPLEWTFVGMSTIAGTPVELWRRPGATSAFSIKAIPDGPAVAWSDACGLPAGKGHRLTKWRVYCLLHHNGDEEAPARAIRARAREMAR